MKKPKPEPVSATSPTVRRPAHVSKRLLQARLPEATVIKLRVLAAKRNVTLTSLIEEGVAWVLRREPKGI